MEDLYTVVNSHTSNTFIVKQVGVAGSSRTGTEVLKNVSLIVREASRFHISQTTKGPHFSAHRGCRVRPGADVQPPSYVLLCKSKLVLYT